MDRDRKIVFTVAIIATIIYLYAALAGTLTTAISGASAVFLALVTLTLITLNDGNGFEIFFFIFIDILIGTIIFIYLGQKGMFPLGIGTGLGILWTLYFFYPSLKRLIV